MNVQSSINQVFSLASLLASQTPMAAKRKEAAAIEAKKESDLKNIERKQMAVYEQLGAQAQTQRPESDPTEQAAISQILGEHAEVAHERFKLDPTAENLKRYKGALSQTEAKRLEFERINNRAAKAKEDAAKNLADKQAEKRASREFMEMFIKGTPSQYANEYKGGSN